MISYSQSLKFKNEISVSAVHVEEVSDLVKFNAHIH